MIGATDAHAKNFGVLLAGPQVALAPLYDTASWIPYAVRPQRYRFAMKLGNDYRLVKGTPGRDWTVTARSMGLDRASAVGRIVGLAGRLPAAFATAVTAIDDDSFKHMASDLAESILGHVERNRRALDYEIG